MTLAQKLASWIAALIVGLVLLAAASLSGLQGLNQNLDEALSQHNQLRQIYEIGLLVGGAREILTAGIGNRAAAADRIDAAINQFTVYLLSRQARSPGQLVQPLDATGNPSTTAEDTMAALLEVRRRIDTSDAWLPGPREITQDVRVINSVITGLQQLSERTREEIQRIQSAAREKMHATRVALGVLSAAILLGAIAIGVWQYRGVMVPLGRLGRGVQSIAAGKFSNRLPVEGDDEFARLATEFNRMAGELHDLYRSLEEKVAAKSKELVRSERLASVGFLAAGVAHEINNPLSIISGHAELLLKKLERLAKLEQQAVAEFDARARSNGDMAESLTVIRDEAFRCKQITQKLLSLARSGGEGGEVRLPVSLGTVAQDVRDLVAGLTRFKDRKLELRVKEGQELFVLASESELKQVLLNLVVNALEAVEPNTGRVVIDVRRDEPWVQMAVVDNGRGMTPQQIEKCFEPFYTDKRGAAEPGTGLGLAITHAIVEDHRGRIAALSDGPGKGCRFIVRLPALGQEERIRGSKRTQA